MDLRSIRIRTILEVIVIGVFVTSAAFTLAVAFPSFKLIRTTLETAVLSIVVTTLLGTVVLAIVVVGYVDRVR